VTGARHHGFLLTPPSPPTFSATSTAITFPVRIEIQVLGRELVTVLAVSLLRIMKTNMLKWCDEHEMRWIDAPSFLTHVVKMHPFRNGVPSKEPRHSMGSNDVPVANPKVSVPAYVE
jgi:hypothetical protein